MENERCPSQGAPAVLHMANGTVQKKEDVHTTYKAMRLSAAVLNGSNLEGISRA